MEDSIEDPLSKIDEKIIRLKKQKERVQKQQAVLFLREAQKILGDKFSTSLALHMLGSTWKASSDEQKKEWISKTRGQNTKESFRKKSSGDRVQDPKNQSENSVS